MASLDASLVCDETLRELNITYINERSKRNEFFGISEEQFDLSNYTDFVYVEYFRYKIFFTGYSQKYSKLECFLKLKNSGLDKPWEGFFDVYACYSCFKPEVLNKHPRYSNSVYQDSYEAQYTRERYCKYTLLKDIFGDDTMWCSYCDRGLFKITNEDPKHPDELNLEEDVKISVLDKVDT